MIKKHRVKITKIGPELTAEEAIETFYQLLQPTTDRDHFSAHPKDYYHSLIETIPPLQTTNYKLPTNPTSQIYLAQYKNKYIASILVTFFKDTATYYFGASSNEHRHLMAPYLLHWQSICDAQKAGYLFYDLFGIAPQNEPNHPWQGVTEFKKKFGGTIYHYASAQEYVFKPFWYWLIVKAKRIL